MPGGRGRGAFRGRGGVPSRAFGGGVALGPPTTRREFDPTTLHPMS